MRRMGQHESRKEKTINSRMIFLKANSQHCLDYFRGDKYAWSRIGIAKVWCNMLITDARHQKAYTGARSFLGRPGTDRINLLKEDTGIDAVEELEQCICNSELKRNLWRQRGRVVRALDLQFRGTEFKSRHDR